MWHILVMVSIVSSLSHNNEWISFNERLDKSPEIEVTAHSQFNTLIEMNLPGIHVSEQIINERKYSFIEIPGEYTFLSDVGKPGLPTMEKWIAVPDNKNVELKIISYTCDTLKAYIPAPFQDRFRFKEFMIDEDFYEQDMNYPPEIAMMSTPGILRDYRFVILTFQPVVYNPAKEEIYVYHNIFVELNYSGISTTNVLERTRPYTSYAFEPIYKHLFINYDFIRSDSVARGTYLIITADALNATIQPLADWRNREGRRVKVVNISDVCNPPADSLIREYLMDAYFTWEYPPEYLLLVGDVQDIPTHIIPQMSDCATDFLYYGNLDGTLSNGYEILVGRLSTSDAGTLTTMIDRIMDYQRDPYLTDPTWYRKACTINGAEWHGLPSAINIRNDLLDYGFSWIDTLYSRSGGATTANITNAVNSGRLFTAYFGHGWPNGWWLTDWSNTFDNNDVYALTNGEKVPIVLAASCGTGMFQNTTCHGEAWTREKGIAYIGAGATPASSMCEQVPTRFIDTYVDSIYNLGQCSGIGIGNFGFNLLGDPGTTMWADAPVAITCTYNATMPVGTNEFTVLVQESGSPVQGATVCLMSTNDVYCVGKTEVSGQVTLYPVPRSDDTVYVTVTSPFHIPHQGIIMVDHGTSFPGYLSHTIDEATGGNGNGVLNPGETVYMTVTLKNYGDVPSNNITAILRTTDTLVAITDSSKSYGDLAPGAQATRTFGFAVSYLYPYQGEQITLIPFTMQVTDISKSTWEFSVSEEEIRSPDIVYVSHTVPGSPQPGDTCSILLTLENIGKDSVSSTVAYITTTDPYVTIITDSSYFGPMGVGASGNNASNPFEFTTHPTTPAGYTITFMTYPRTSGWINWVGQKNETFDVMIGETPPSCTLFFDDFEHAGDFDTTKWWVDSTHWFVTGDDFHSGAWSVSPDTNYPGDPLIIRPHLDLSRYPQITWSQWSHWMMGRCCLYIDTLSNGDWVFMGFAGWSPTWQNFGRNFTPTSNWTSVRFKYEYMEEGIPPYAFVDDVAITTPRDNVPPSFANTTVWKDTSHLGPFPVYSIIQDNMYEVDQCSLYYRINDGSWSVVQLDTTLNPDEYTAEIPAQSIDDTIYYYLSATDDFLTPNRGTDPIGAPEESNYSFVIKPPIGIAENVFPKTYILYQNYPNPFVRFTSIKYALPIKSKVSLKVYNVLGRLVRTLVKREQDPGFYDIQMYPQDNANKKLAAGIYFLKFSAGDVSFTKKLILLTR